MKPKDWFVVGVRLIGVWWLVEASQELFYFINAEMGYSKSTLYLPGTYGVHAVGNFVVGLFLISGAKLLMSFAGDWDSDDDDPKDGPS